MNDNKNENRKGNANSLAINRKTVLVFTVCVALILLVAQFDAVKNAIGWVFNMLAPIFTGVIFAYILNPFCNIIEKRFLRIFNKSKKMRPTSKRRVSHGLGVLFSILLLIAVIVLLLFLIIPEFLVSFDKLLDIAPSLIQKGGDWLASNIDSESTFGQHLGESIDSLASNLTNWIGGELSTLIGGLLEGAISVVYFLLDFLISLIVCVYALLEKNKFLAQFKKLIYAFFSPARANDILDVARYGNNVFGKFISGKLLTSTIVGVVTFVFMSAMRMPYALLSAGIIAITNVIPFFGPFIGGIPTAFIILLTDARDGVIYIIFLLVLQQIEGNIIEPMIMEDRTGLSKFWVTVALLFCGGMFGLAGMIFSVPLFAVLFYVIKVAVDRSLAKKSLPLAGTAYINVGSVDPETLEFSPVPEKTPRKKLRDTLAEWRARILKKSDNDGE